MAIRAETIKLCLISCLLFALVPVQCEYELRVTFYTYSNPNERCSDCTIMAGDTPGCCDNYQNKGVCGEFEDCEPYMIFYLCDGELVNNEECIRIDTLEGQLIGPPVATFTNTVLGLQNPVTFQGDLLDGFLQLRIIIMDRDHTGPNSDGLPDDLIDSFTIDITTPVGTSSNRTTYTGEADIVQLELSFELVCALNYYGPSCDTLCEEIDCPCEPGFSGEFCQIDDCDVLDCINGECEIEETDSPTCECEVGYTGDRCHIMINHCEAPEANCGPNGVCVNREDSFACDCIQGYTGDRCDTIIDNCNVLICGLNANCMNQINNFTCICNPGYTGQRCEIDLCDLVDCGSNGICVNGIINEVTCVCHPLYTGERCEMMIDYCNFAAVDCGPNGECVTQVATGTPYACDCNPGYTGVQCQTDIDDCMGVVCSGNRICVDGVNSYDCQSCETMETSCNESVVPDLVGKGNDGVINTIAPIIAGVLGAAVVVIAAVVIVIVVAVCLVHRRRHDKGKTAKPLGDYELTDNLTYGRKQPANPITVQQLQQQENEQQEQQNTYANIAQNTYANVTQNAYANAMPAQPGDDTAENKGQMTRNCSYGVSALNMRYDKMELSKDEEQEGEKYSTLSSPLKVNSPIKDTSYSTLDKKYVGSVLDEEQQYERLQ